ncbi:MAG: efflux RND transporter periplasmic adaptor subunit, partial [Gemmatimonadales bacterium]
MKPLPFRFGIAVVALGALAAAGCKPKSNAAADPNTPTTAAVDSSKTSTLALPVVGEPVRKGDLILTVSARGQIASDAVTTINAQASGTVDSVLVRLGDHVRAGQVLVKLDAKPLDLDVRAAQAQLDAANVKFNTDVYADSLVEGRVRPERNKFLRAQDGIEGAQVQLDKARLALDHAVITAPFDGMIESLSVAPGDQVSSGAVVQIVDMKNLRVEAEVLEHDIPLLRIGGEAIVTV